MSTGWLTIQRNGSIPDPAEVWDCWFFPADPAEVWDRWLFLSGGSFDCVSHQTGADWTLRFSVSYTGTAGIPNKESKMQCFLGVHPWEPCQSLCQFLGEALGREIRVWGSEEAGNAHCHTFSLVSCSHSSGLAKNLWNGNTQGPEGSRFGGQENFTACLLRKGCNLITVV